MWPPRQKQSNRVKDLTLMYNLAWDGQGCNSEISSWLSYHRGEIIKSIRLVTLSRRGTAVCNERISNPTFGFGFVNPPTWQEAQALPKRNFPRRV